MKIIHHDSWQTTVMEALQEYCANGKTIKDFEADYECSVMYERRPRRGTVDILFQNDSCRTAFMLKYKL